MVGIRIQTLALKSLKKRAVAKFLTRKHVLSLVDLDSPLKKGYWNTYYCNHVLEQTEHRLQGRYCSNRWCLVCSRIKAAKLINGYRPVIDTFNDPTYGVLSVKNVKAEDLREKIQEMSRNFRKITDLLRKRDQIYVQALRTIEVTYNWKTKEYHPHFNYLVNGLSIGKLIIQEWLSYFSSDEADPSGQYCKKANKGSLNELLKYIVKPDDKTSAQALDVIYCALYGMKIVCPTGIKKVSEEIADLISVEIPELPAANRQWWWNQDKKDWMTRLCWPDPEGVLLLKTIEKHIKLLDSS